MIQLLVGSKSWINDCAFDEISGNYLAVVSDDSKVKIWKGIEDLKSNDCIEDLCEMVPATFTLQSRGISIQFRSVQWHPENPTVFGVIYGSKWIIYSIQETNVKNEFVVDHFGETDICGGIFRWGNSISSKMFAVTGKISLVNPSVHIFPNGFTKVPYTLNLPSKSRITDIAWNQSANVLYISSSNKIHFMELP